MNYGFAVYYIESNVVCAIVFAILLIHNRFNIDRQEKQIKFDRALVAFILYFLIDCVWAAIVADIIPKTRATVIINNFLVYLMMAATIYFWLDYVMAYEHVAHRNRPINRFAVLFPFLVSTVALIVNYIFAPQVLIDKNLDVTLGYSVYLVAVPYIYMAAVLFYTIRKSRSEKKFSEKRKHLFIGFFPLIAIIGGLVQIIFAYLPIYCFSVMTLMLIFYIQSIELRVSVDPLTQLSNRSQLARYISSRSNPGNDDAQTYVVMMDIDGFKSINDTYGHAEGDKALVIVSGAFSKVVNGSSIPSFLGRYGGDEFILILHPSSKEEADQLILDIRGELERASENSPYPLSVSVGCDQLMGGQDSFQDCIRRADKRLYIDKSYKRAGTVSPKATG